MTIHHDKLAYGKLAPESEDLSEERIAEMLARLNGSAETDTANDGGANKTDGKKRTYKEKKK